VFLVFTAITLVALYRFSNVHVPETPGPASVDALKQYGEKLQAAAASTPVLKPSSSLIAQVPTSRTTKFDYTPSPTPSVSSTSESNNKAGPAIMHSDLPPSHSKPPTIPVHQISDRPPPTAPEEDERLFDDIHEGGQGRQDAIIWSTDSAIHWTKLPEHFPVASESLIPLPTGKPKSIPKIQKKGPDESTSARREREHRQASVKEAFEHAWSGYKEHAWLHDEVTPVSGDYRDPFCKWSATLVDALDTLWIMGLKKEFEQALEGVKMLDFTTSPRTDIPLFETTIRYLGGLLGAYDVSGARYSILLEKAVELAEVLMGAFDTPNRMPLTFYYWKP
jgi:mannosyl-oligosaccharide alpha-1,2-mannosidase